MEGENECDGLKFRLILPLPRVKKMLATNFTDFHIDDHHQAFRCANWFWQNGNSPLATLPPALRGEGTVGGKPAGAETLVHWQNALPPPCPPPAKPEGG